MTETPNMQEVLRQHDAAMQRKVQAEKQKANQAQGIIGAIKEVQVAEQQQQQSNQPKK